MAMEFIREQSRELGRQDRIQHRDETYNRNRRSLGDIRITDDRLISPKEVKEIAALIKKKSSANSEQLSFLKTAFIQNEANIDAFLKDVGALNVVIKELSGQDAVLQLAAAHCCCNLALGNSKLSCQVTKAAASYLTLHLQGASSTLTDICAWTLGNLAASDSTSWEILSNQGTGLKLAHLLQSENPEVINSAIYALAHYVRAGGDRLCIQELRLICNNASPLFMVHTDVYWLIYLLSCYESCDEILLDNNIMQLSMKCLSEIVTTEHCNVKHITALLRIAGNLSSEQNGMAARFLTDFPAETAVVFSNLLSMKHQHVKQEALWVLGNLCNHSSSESRDRFHLSGMLGHLSHVPVISTAL